MDNRIFSKMFMWLGFGLLLTFLTGYIVATNENMLEFLYTNNWMLITCAICEVALVIFLSARIRSMSGTTASICFILYSFVTGLTFSSIFVLYEISSIIYIFGITSLILLICSLIGYILNIDLSKFSSILLMILLAILITSIANIFIGSETLNFGITIISVIIFIIYIAYDINRVKYLINSFPDENLAIYGALQLYLDFINIFIDLLRLFAKRRD